MRRTTLVSLATAALALTAGCADPAAGTAPNPNAGSPRFATAFTDLTAPSGAHFRKGSGEPTCAASGLAVSCTGTRIAGVGNTDAELSLTVTYSATVQCRNHGGQIVEVKTQSTTTTPAPDATTELRNGTLTVSPFSAASAPTEQSFLDAATCPNPNWDKLFLAGSPAVASFTYTLTFEGYPEPAITVTG